MKKQLILTTLLLSLLGVSSWAEQPSNCSTGCAMIEAALNDLSHIKPGSERQELDKNFKLAGGMTFRDRTTYVHKSCQFLKVEVEFTFDSNVHQDFSPRDTIKSISKLTVDYPTSD